MARDTHPASVAEHQVLVVIGGGPRAAMLLERLAANAPELAEGPVDIHLVEPFNPASGRIWRPDQSPLLKLNSMAQDVTLFTDGSVDCLGPAADGPSLSEWRDAVLAGRLTDVPALDDDLRRQLRDLGPQDFPTRRLQSVYLEWFFARSVAGLPPGFSLRVHQDRAVELIQTGDEGAGRGWLVRLAGGSRLAADAVVVAVGHADGLPSGASVDYARFAAEHAVDGTVYIPPAYTNDVDLSALPPGRDVIVSGMGLAFIDLMVLVTEGRGGTFEEDQAGRLRYRPSGREPRLWVGSRRGVPYHSKIRGNLQGLPAEPPRFLTREAVDGLRAEHGALDFAMHLWPLLAKDMAYAYYRELLTGHPHRSAMGWPEFAERFAEMDWYSASRRALVTAAVPDPSWHLEFEEVNRPFQGRNFADIADIQHAVTEHIAHDLHLRDGGANSETLGLFLGLLGVYMELGRVLPLEAMTPESRSTVSGWWHGFFSFVDSGPPAHRLRELLALHDAGLVRFLGPGVRVRTEPRHGVFTAVSDHGRIEFSARAFIEARLPDQSLTAATDPLLRRMVADGLAVPDPDGSGKMLVDADYRVIRHDRSPHRPADTLFAVGAGTTSWGQGAFARPRSNAAPFRDTDALARTVLRSLTSVRQPMTDPVPVEVPDIHEDELIARITMVHSSLG